MDPLWSLVDLYLTGFLISLWSFFLQLFLIFFFLLFPPDMCFSFNYYLPLFFFSVFLILLSDHSPFLFPPSHSRIILSQCRSGTGMGGMCWLFCALLAASCCVNCFFIFIYKSLLWPPTPPSPASLSVWPSVFSQGRRLTLSTAQKHLQPCSSLSLIAMSVRRYSSAARTSMADLLGSFALWKHSLFSDYLTATVLPNRLPDYCLSSPS